MSTNFDAAAWSLQIDYFEPMRSMIEYERDIFAQLNGECY